MNQQISIEQINFIDSLVCERISTNEENRRLVYTFLNPRNPVLADMLQKAWDIDRANESAYYVVKTQEGTLLAYFSLKCGLLYDTINEEYYKQMKKLQEILLNPDEASEEQRAIFDFLRSKYGDIDAVKMLKKKAEKANDLLLSVKADIEKEEGSQVHQVSQTYPSIEIENFCTNENAKAVWNRYGMPRKLGEIVFWCKIMPLVERIERIIGCTHLFLFAADSSDDEKLINYYHASLGFSTTPSLGANKPIYDLLCQLMCQTIENAKTTQRSFFDHFND